MRKLLACTLVAAFVAAEPNAAFAEWPEQPIQIIVPFGAGGGSDATVRLFQKVIEDHELLPQPLVVINNPGAGGRTGSRRVLDAEPDGYTFLSNHQTLLSSEASGLADFGYRDFTPVASTGEVCLVVVVPSKSSYETLDDLMQAAATRPDEIVFGANLGALNHMAGKLLEGSQDGASFRFVQIGGDAKNYAAVKGGIVQTSLISTGQFKASGGDGIRPLAILAPERHPELPDVPTARELGYDTDFCFGYWWLAPKGTPQEAIDGLADALEQAMQTDEVRQAFEDRAYLPVFRRGEAFQDYIAAEYSRIAPVAKEPTQ